MQTTFIHTYACIYRPAVIYREMYTHPHTCTDTQRWRYTHTHREREREREGERGQRGTERERERGVPYFASLDPGAGTAMWGSCCPRTNVPVISRNVSAPVGRRTTRKSVERGV